MSSLPGSGDRPSGRGASPARLAEWQTRRLEALRPRPTVFDDLLPLDLLADVEASRRAIDAARARLG